MRRYLPLASLLIAACGARAPAAEPAANKAAQQPEACAEPPCDGEEAPFLTALLESPDGDDDDADRHDDGTEFDHTLGTEEPIDPFGVTPNDVVAQMLTLADVGKQDVVYDLGSGDGRIPIAAAKRGARGVGIELRSELVEESRETAKEEGVAKRVRFIEGDIFEADLSDATVVMFYLYPRTTLQLRPKLLSELRPGTRIVAFDYGIESWPRDKEEPVPNPYRTEDLDYGTLYYYVVPANVSGTWKTSVSRGSKGPQALVLHLEQTFQQVRGKAMAGGDEIPLRDVKLSGDTLTFSLTMPGGESLSFEGKATGHRLTGRAERDSAKAGGAPARVTWKASRDPKSKTSIDLPQPTDASAQAE